MELQQTYSAVGSQKSLKRSRSVSCTDNSLHQANEYCRNCHVEKNSLEIQLRSARAQINCLFDNHKVELESFAQCKNDWQTIIVEQRSLFE